MTKNILKSFSIDKLFGYKNVNIKFEDKYLVFVGENGSGKTTILNSLYYVLTKDLKKLLDIPFENIHISFADTKLSLSKYEIEAYVNRNTRYREQGFYKILSEVVTPRTYKSYLKIIQSPVSLDMKAQTIYEMLQKKGYNFRIPSSRYVYMNMKRVVDEYVASDVEQRVHVLDVFESIPILYFPTYRRVESTIEESNDEMGAIPDLPEFEDVSKQQLAKLENLNFGMSDVRELISNLLQEINIATMRGFRQVLVELLGEMANPRMATPRRVENSAVEIVLDRLSGQISETDKEAIKKYAQLGKTADSHMNFLINKLIELYESQKDLDDAIKNFIHTCNAYLVGKSFVYNESAVDLTIYTENEDNLSLDKLSSGEKQVVAMFAKLYLSRIENCIVLLDEPEISLSLEWQRQLLPHFVESGKCAFLMAVTHSPFIFENDLESVTYGINDFVSIEK